MKKLKCLVALFAICFFCTTVQAQVRNADTMVNKLFTALKNKDEASFLALYPTGKQMGNLVKGMLETMFKSPEMQQMMAMDEKSKNMNIDSLVDVQVSQMNKPETQAEMQKGFARNFKEIIEKGEKKGVNWNQAQLTSYSLDSTSEMEGEEMKMFGGSGIKNLKGVIDFRSAGTDYQMNFDKILLIPSENGWFGGEFKQVIKKGESFVQEPSGDEEDKAETPKADTKSKTKTEGDKTKTKAKTPATKTKTKTKTKA